MTFTRRVGRLGSGRGRLSLRSRLLAGLITVTALFLIVMGVVTTLVLGNTEQNQFDTDLSLTARIKLSEVAGLQGGYAIAYYNTASRSVGAVSSPSAATTELEGMLNNLATTRGWQDFRTDTPAGQLFSIAGPPALTAIWRPVTAAEAERSNGTLPAGTSILVIARPNSAVGSEVRGLVAAELITGAILLALLAVGGRWLISRGLAPLDRMASTADMITSRGDLTARMPDPGDHAEAGRLAGAINTMLDRIQQAFSARWESEQKVRQFAADASHELRTPLTTIRGYAELYRQGALGPDRLPNAMRRIEQEADRMSSLVAELLELARLDRDSSLDLTETDLSALVADAVADAQAVEPKPAGQRQDAAQPGGGGRRAADQAGARQPARQRPRAHLAGDPGRGPALRGRPGRAARGDRRGPGHVRGGGGPRVRPLLPGRAQRQGRPRQRPRAVHRAGDRRRARRPRHAQVGGRRRHQRAGLDPVPPARPGFRTNPVTGHDVQLTRPAGRRGRA